MSQPGTTELGGASQITFLGTLTQNEGTLVLNKSVGTAILGNLIVGDQVGGPASDVLRYGPAAGSDQIANTATAPTVTVNSAGFLNLNGISDTINALLTVQDAPSYSTR